MSDLIPPELDRFLQLYEIELLPWQRHVLGHIMTTERPPRRAPRQELEEPAQ